MRHRRLGQGGPLLEFGGAEKSREDFHPREVWDTTTRFVRGSQMENACDLSPFGHDRKRSPFCLLPDVNSFPAEETLPNPRPCMNLWIHEKNPDLRASENDHELSHEQ